MTNNTLNEKYKPQVDVYGNPIYMKDEYVSSNIESTNTAFSFSNRFELTMNRHERRRAKALQRNIK